jgi:hypothetical protein
LIGFADAAFATLGIARSSLGAKLRDALADGMRAKVPPERLAPLLERGARLEPAVAQTEAAAVLAGAP